MKMRILHGIALTSLACLPAHAEMSAGAGKAEITITPDMLPLDGFTSVHDQLQARVMLLDDGHSRFALVVLDQTAISGDLVTAFQEQVAQLVKTSPASVWIVASNNFSAPHVFLNRPDAGTIEYRKAMDRAIERATLAAKAELQPACIGYAAGNSDVNINRNVEMVDGWWLGSNEAGTSDKTVSMLVAKSVTATVIGVVFNYPVQSSVMDQTGGVNSTKGVTGDLGGFAALRTEQLLGNDAVALFTTGASGDQAPKFTAVRYVYDTKGHFSKVDIGADGYAFAELQGERLGTETARVAKTGLACLKTASLEINHALITLPAKQRPGSLKDIKPTRDYDFSVTGTVDMPYTIVRIGDGVLIGTQVQLDAATGMEIKRHSPFRNTLIVNMVNGGAKYLASAAGYKAITYQAMNSGFAPGGAEKLSARILADLKAIKKRADKSPVRKGK